MGPLIFEQLVNAVSDKMYRFAWRMLGSGEDAKDVVQDALLKLWHQREKLLEVRNPEAWCMQMTKNLCLDRFKANKTRSEAERHLKTRSGEEQHTPYRAMEQKDLSDQLQKLIGNLPEKQQLILHLRDVEGLAYKEIAATLDITMDDVKVGLFRARSAVKENLAKQRAYGLP